VVVERRGSAIAGRGLFTVEAVPRGMSLDADVGLLNHSCDPSLAWGSDGARLEAFRELLEFRRESDAAVEGMLGGASPLLVRSYLIITAVRPMSLVVERLPTDLFA
jgi:hypothetical protein